MARGKPRWGIFVHDPDGDMGEGIIVGAFHSPEAAEGKAEKIRTMSELRSVDAEGVECIVVPLVSASEGAGSIIASVG